MLQALQNIAASGGLALGLSQGGMNTTAATVLSVSLPLNETLLQQAEILAGQPVTPTALLVSPAAPHSSCAGPPWSPLCMLLPVLHSCPAQVIRRSTAASRLASQVLGLHSNVCACRSLAGGAIAGIALGAAAALAMVAGALPLPVQMHAARASIACAQSPSPAGAHCTHLSAGLVAWLLVARKRHRAKAGALSEVKVVHDEPPANGHANGAANGHCSHESPHGGPVSAAASAVHVCSRQTAPVREAGWRISRQAPSPGWNAGPASVSTPPGATKDSLASKAINANQVVICRFPNGEEWLLGAGSFGKVRQALGCFCGPSTTRYWLLASQGPSRVHWWSTGWARELLQRRWLCAWHCFADDARLCPASSLAL